MLMANLQDDISDKELKQRWRLYWLQTIFELANINLQKMAWIEQDNAKWPDDEAWISSFDESMSAYFDILALDDAYEKALANGNVSTKEAEAAQKLHQHILAYIEPSEDPHEILNDEEWIELTHVAQELWQRLKENITSSREKELIDDLQQKFPF